MTGRPSLVAIDHDDYHAEYVGRTADGRQFFLTTPFVPGGPEYLALYLFDSAGTLVEARIQGLGSRAGLDHQAREALRDEWLAGLGPLSYERIEVAPFAVTYDDVEFGLVARPPADEDDAWWVELEPGNFMAFSEPWDSGEYDT